MRCVPVPVSVCGPSLAGSHMPTSCEQMEEKKRDASLLSRAIAPLWSSEGGAPAAGQENLLGSASSCLDRVRAPGRLVLGSRIVERPRT